MKKFIKENWFKITIIILLLIVVTIYYQNQQEQDKIERETTLDSCLGRTWDRYAPYVMSKETYMIELDIKYLKLGQDRCFGQYK